MSQNIQKFSNNAKTVVASGPLLVGGTTLNVAAGGGALFQTIASPNYELLTLVRASDKAVEIVKVTAHTAAADSFTIVRAQEGTTALQFEDGDTVQARLTAVSLERFVSRDIGGDARGTDVVEINPKRTVAGNVAKGNRSVVLGVDAHTDSGSTEALAIGYYAKVLTGAQGIALGYKSHAAAAEALAIGKNSFNRSARAANLAAPFVIRNADQGLAASTPQLRGQLLCGSEAIFTSNEYDLKVTTWDCKIALPSNSRFHPTEIGIIANYAYYITTPPSMRAGVILNGAEFMAATSLNELQRSSGTAGTAHRVAIGNKDPGTTYLYADLTVAAVTAYSAPCTGRVFFKGILIDEA